MAAVTICSDFGAQKIRAKSPHLGLGPGRSIALQGEDKINDPPPVTHKA